MRLAEARTSALLDAHGIPGNTYKDQSPQTDKPTYNYVVFHPDNLDIRTMDGIPLTPVDHTPDFTTAPTPGGTP